MSVRKLFITLLCVWIVFSCSDGELEGDLYPVSTDKGGNGNTTEKSDDPIIQKLIKNMQLINTQEFRMGNNNDDGAKPEHTVRLNKFYISKYEVSQKEWQAVMGDNPSEVQNGSNTDFPVTDVSYDDCLEFIEKLNDITQMEFSLPTEAQWEYAARGGENTTYSSYLFYYKNNSDNRLHDVCPQGYELNDYTNNYGLAHMSGNVAEWCSDYAASYGSELVVNPTGPKTGSNRIIRGGSCLMAKNECAVYKRFSMSPYKSQGDVGFRLALKELKQIKCSKNTLEFAKEGGTQTVEITSIDPVVECSVDSSWVKLVKKGTKLTVTVEPNLVKHRTADIRIYCKSNGENTYIPVKQEGLIFDIAYDGKMIDTLYIPWQGCSNERLTVEQSKLVSWNVYSLSGWCKVDKQTSNSFVLTAYENLLQSERSTYITINDTKGGMSDIICVVQRAKPYLQCLYQNEEVESLQARQDEASGFIEVNTNVAQWTVKSNATSWCVIEDKTSNSFVIRIKALPIYTKFRETTIEVEADGLICTIPVSQSKLPQVGEVYNQNGVIGVIYEVSSDGRSGKIVSLNESTKNWSSNVSSSTYATSYDNGEANMQTICNLSSWTSYYPAFYYCYNLGTGWYLPAKDELAALFEAVRSYGSSKFDQVLSDNGGQEFSSASDYWSSTEVDYEWAYTVNKLGTVRSNVKKNNNYRVRAIRKVTFD